MVRTKRSAKLDTWNARKKLPMGKMNQEPIAPGQYLAYRRPENGAAGSWLVRFRQDGKIHQSRLGLADDYADADGRDVLNFQQAQAKAQAWFDQKTQEARLVRDGAVLTGDPLTVAQALAAYLDHQERVGKKSAADARKRTDLHILPALGNLTVESLTRLRLERWRDDLAASPKGKRKSARPGPAPENPEPVQSPRTADEKRARKASANRVLSTLKAALTYALDRGLVHCPDTAWTKTKPYRGTEEARQNYLTPEEQQRLLNAIQEPDFRRLVAGALATGCRYGELGRLQAGDFDPVGGTVLIKESKGGKPRRVPLTLEGRSLFAALTAGMGRRDQIFTLEAFPDMRRVDPETGEPIPKIRRGWKAGDQFHRMADACLAAGLPRMGFHQLRHSYASSLVAAGMPLAFVAQLTGHADIRMLERHYAHLAASDVKKALEAFAPGLDLGAAAVEPLKIKRG